jgi:hypothetical protein
MPVTIDPVADERLVWVTVRVGASWTKVASGRLSDPAGRNVSCPRLLYRGTKESYPPRRRRARLVHSPRVYR